MVLQIIGQTISVGCVHRCKPVQIAVAVVQGKTFNRDDLAVVPTCVVGAFREPS